MDCFRDVNGEPPRKGAVTSKIRIQKLPGTYPAKFLFIEFDYKCLILWRSLRDSNPCYSLESSGMRLACQFD